MQSHWWGDLRLDLRQSLRLLAKDRAFTASALITLALGIGANIAIFSVINAALLRPLPFDHPERILFIQNTDPRTGDPIPVSAGDYNDFRDRTQTCEAVGLIRYRENLSLSLGKEAESITVHLATSSVFQAFGVSPVIGRLFTPEEERMGGDQAILLSYGAWQTRFGGRREIVGSRVSVGGAPGSIVGVLPPGFEYPDRPAEAWVPLVPTPSEVQERFQHRYRIVARRKADVPLQRVSEEFQAINAQIKLVYPKVNNFGMLVEPLSEQRVAASKSGLVLLMAAVGLVLLIACANVASLLLARATSRQKEISIRAALGASRGRLLRQVLTESLLLALAGGVAGIAVAYWSLQAITGLLPANLPGRDSIAIDAMTLAFAVTASLLTGMLFGVSPALNASHSSAADALRQRSNSGSRTSLRLRSALVVAEVAISAILLVGGGLLLRSFLRVISVDSGLETQNVLSMSFSLPRPRYAKAEATTRFFDELLRRLKDTPGVESAGIVNRLPLNGSLGTGPMGIEGRPYTAEDIPVVDVRSASEDYFSTLGIKLLDGRGFAETDTAQSTQVALIDDRVAARYWPGENPLGRRLKIGQQRDDNPYSQIVGIVRTVHHDGLDKESRGQVYIPHRQYPVHGLNVNLYSLVVRTAGNPGAMSEAVRRVILQVDPDQTAFEVQPMDQLLDRSLAPRRFQTLLVAAFAALALALASFGLYAVIAYSVTLRTPEIGVRVALGAGVGDVLALVASETARLVAAGLVLGLAGAALLTRWLEGLLFGVSRLDVTAFVAAGAIVALVALLATLAPARRALRVDPSRALAAEG